MVTYLYWIAVIAVSVFVFWGIGRYFKTKIGLICGLVVFLAGWLMYVFHYEQYFVKHLGGVMSIENREGELHIQATWKDDNLWVESYNPEKNICYFREYSKGNLLEGKVTIKNCNPLLPSAAK
jgi:hypothetical protein